MGRLAVAAIVSIWTIPILILVNRIVPEPYMDEIFHIPQTQKYCRGEFRSWDPMITTPPGLYCLSIAYAASLFPRLWFKSAGLSFPDLCSTPILRSFNGVLAVVCSIIIYDILILLRPGLGERKATLYAVVLSMFPLHWFFTFLYYTDVASLTVVLAMYLVCLNQQFWLSALLGALAVFIRQTNVIWVVFVACIGAINYKPILTCEGLVQLDHPTKSTGKVYMVSDKKRLEIAPDLRRRKMNSSLNMTSSSPRMTNCSLPHGTGFLREAQDIISRLWSQKWQVLMHFSPFMIVLVAFCAFVIWNGSVVLGAKEAHLVSPHFAQMMYFGLFSAVAMFPVHFNFSQASFLCNFLRKNRLVGFFQGLVALIVGLISVHFFSIAHPYLLADNRHYPFYIWKKVIRAHWLMKYLLVPLYVYSWFSSINILGKVQKRIWVLLYILMCAAALVPAPLVEFRYYTIPFYFMILHSHPDDYRSWLIIGISYTAVNLFTMMMFLFRPFYWDHEPGTQRFMW